MSETPRRRNLDDPSIYRSSGSTVRKNVDTALGLEGRAALVAVRRLLDDDVPWLEERAVRLARDEGDGWATIARLLKRSRQGVWKKHGAIDDTPMLPPLRPTTLEERVMSSFRGRQADSRRRREFEETDPGDIVAW